MQVVILTISIAVRDLHQWYIATYRQTSNIRRTQVGIKIADHSDVVVGASPVDAAPTISSFST